MTIFEHEITGSELKLSVPAGIDGFCLVDKRFGPKSVVAVHIYNPISGAIPIHYHPSFRMVLISDQKLEFRYSKTSDTNPASLIGNKLLVFLA